jgi:ribosome biogenesis GTPase
MPHFRRKPHRKAILRDDSARLEGELLPERTVVRSTQLKKDPSKHRQKADCQGRIVGVASAVWLVEDQQSYQAPHTQPFAVSYHCIPGGVVTSDNPPDESLLAVGDWVEIAKVPDDEGKGIIVHVQARQSRLFRQSPAQRQVQVIAANVDRAFLVHAVTQPHFSRRLLDRQLIACEQGGVEPIVVMNKIDQGIAPELKETMAYYHERLGIELCLTSAVTGEGIDTLRSLMQGYTCVLVGASGVGKSALLNACFGQPIQQVREISRKYERGRHTTTNARLFHLPGGGQLIDTPGVREFALAHLHPEELAFYFHDFDPYYPQCKYLPCTHTHEPDCAVRAAVDAGLIQSERYESYVLILESLINDLKEQ